MAPKLEWLQTRLDLDDVQLKRMVLALPQLLIYSIEDNLAPKLDWLAGSSRPGRRGAEEDGATATGSAELQRRG